MATSTPSFSLSGNAQGRKRSTLEIALDNLSLVFPDGVACVTLHVTDDGKGTGAQKIPVDQMPEFLDAWEELSANGNVKVASNLTAADRLRETAHITEAGELQIRVDGGKGSKPTRCSPADVAGVVSMLRNTLEKLTPDFIASARAQVAK